jgi:hypothetical protein
MPQHLRNLQRISQQSVYLLQSFCELQLCPGNLQLPKQLCDESEWKLRELQHLL